MVQTVLGNPLLQVRRSVEPGLSLRRWRQSSPEHQVPVPVHLHEGILPARSRAFPRELGERDQPREALTGRVLHEAEAERREREVPARGPPLLREEADVKRAQHAVRVPMKCQK